LLVVIGIIALLISILLPALGKARAQANLIACASNLRNIGQALNEYEADNKGCIPYAAVQNIGSPVWWFWSDTLSLMLGQKPNPAGGNWVNQPSQLSAIFWDPEVSSQGMRDPRSCDYIANTRIFALDALGFVPQHGSVAESVEPLRTVGSIQRSAEVAMVWDNRIYLTSGPYGSVAGGEIGTQDYDWPYTFGMEEWWITGNPNSGLAFPTSYNGKYTGYGRRILLGSGNAVDKSIGSWIVTGASLQGEIYDNADITSPTGSGGNAGEKFQCEMRFRHLNNTTCNILFVDGHVSPYVIGEVTAKMLCANVNWPASGQ
jgi:prepilin-type processing-associated H-X9-DG protein